MLRLMLPLKLKLMLLLMLLVTKLVLKLVLKPKFAFQPTPHAKKLQLRDRDSKKWKRSKLNKIKMPILLLLDSFALMMALSK